MSFETFVKIGLGIIVFYLGFTLHQLSTIVDKLEKAERERKRMEEKRNADS